MSRFFVCHGRLRDNELKILTPKLLLLKHMVKFQVLHQKTPSQVLVQGLRLISHINSMAMCEVGLKCNV